MIKVCPPFPIWILRIVYVYTQSPHRRWIYTCSGKTNSSVEIYPYTKLVSVSLSSTFKNEWIVSINRSSVIMFKMQDQVQGTNWKETIKENSQREANKNTESKIDIHRKIWKEKHLKIKNVIWIFLKSLRKFLNNQLKKCLKKHILIIGSI